MQQNLGRIWLEKLQNVRQWSCHGRDQSRVTSSTVLRRSNTLYSSRSNGECKQRTDGSIGHACHGHGLSHSVLRISIQEIKVSNGLKFERLCGRFSRSFCSANLHPDCRVLMQIMFLRDWDASLEAELANSGANLTHERVDQIISCIPSPKLALQFFIWSGEQIGYPSLNSCAAYEIMQWYSHKSQVKAFLSILRVLDRRYKLLSPSMVNVLLQGYGWAGMLERAYNLLLQTQGFPNYRFVNCLLHATIKELRFDMVYNIYMEMKNCGTPLHISCNFLIYGMSLGGKWLEADNLLQQMTRLGCFPDVVAYDALIVSLSKAGEHDRVCRIIKDMTLRNLVPANAAFNAAVESLYKSKQTEKALEVISTMQSYGRELDFKLHHAIFS